MTVTDQNFNENVIQAKGVVLVDFWAEWCTPCHMLTPILDQLEDEFKGKDVTIAKFDVDNNPVMATQFGIMSLPTLLLFKDGVVKGQMNGVQPKDAIKAAIERAASA